VPGAVPAGAAALMVDARVLRGFVVKGFNE
jgi:hypothetical protein